MTQPQRSVAGPGSHVPWSPFHAARGFPCTGLSPFSRTQVLEPEDLWHGSTFLASFDFRSHVVLGRIFPVLILSTKLERNPWASPATIAAILSLLFLGLREFIKEGVLTPEKQENLNLRLSALYRRTKFSFIKSLPLSLKQSLHGLVDTNFISEQSLGSMGLGDLSGPSQSPHFMTGCGQDALGSPFALGCKQKGEGW